jgi:hypothetical protein
MAEHARLRVDTGLAIYFCDPQSPWQRGTNENTNGLLRQYFPKGTDLARHSREGLNAVALNLNTRATQDARLENSRRSPRRTSTLCLTRQRCDHRLNLSSSPMSQCRLFAEHGEEVPGIGLEIVARGEVHPGQKVGTDERTGCPGTTERRKRHPLRVDIQLHGPHGSG